MAKYNFLILYFLLIFSCKKVEKSEKYPTINYLIVKQKLDTINAKMNELGIYKPIFSDLKNGKKSLIFFGASHVRDTLHPQFSAIIQAFKTQKPEIAFNEGGQVKDSVKFQSAGKAILADGETGFLKHLCNQANIKMLNGDMDTKEEFSELLNTFPKDQILVYLACERFLNSYRQGFLGKMPIEEAYKMDFLKYLEKYDFKLNSEEKTFTFLKSIYQKHFGKILDLNTLVEVHDYYLNDNGRFGEIGRKSKNIRDQALLFKIDKALDTYDRIFVVFGGSHWVAVQPGLQYILEKHKN
jgi:hypothetical protein